MTRPGWRLITIGVPLVLIAGALALRFGATDGAMRLVADGPAFLVAAIFYLAAHVLRAARFSLIAGRIVSLRMRTLGALYFNAAPILLLVPFKLGELYRLQQLALLAGNVVRPVLVLILDKAFDALVLLAALVLLESAGVLPDALYPFALLLLLLLALGVASLTVLRSALISLQSYILEVHFSARSLRLLRFVDFLRRSIDTARTCIKGNLTGLVCLSVVIWVLEALTLAFIMTTLSGATTLLAVFSLTFTPETVVSDNLSNVFFTYMSVSAAGLLVVWPFATALYLRQITQPGWRPLRAAAADAAPVRLSAFEQPRSLQLHVPRRTL